MPQFSHLVAYSRKMQSMKRYLRCNLMGAYEIAFLPSSGGIDEQDWEWVEDIEKIIYSLNKVNS